MIFPERDRPRSRNLDKPTFYGNFFTSGFYWITNQEVADSILRPTVTALFEQYAALPAYRLSPGGDP